MGLIGLGCCGVDAVAVGRKVSPDARQSAEGTEATKREQQRVVLVLEEKVQKGGEAKPIEGKKKEKKRDNKKDAIVMHHHFPFHSRPGLL